MDHLPKQIRDNAEELREYTRALKEWEEMMKNKDKQLLQSKPIDDNQKNAYEEEDFAEKEEQIKLKHEQADYHKQKGNDFVQKGKWDEAIEQYSLAASMYPIDAAYYGNRSYCYMQLKLWEKAENDCNRALRLKPDYVKVALRRANIRRERGNIKGAAKDYNLALVLDPKNSVALKEYQDIYPELKNFYNDLGIKLPEFFEMNPSAKTENEDEENNADGSTSNQKPKSKEFKLIYPTSIKANKEILSRKTAQKNQQIEKKGDFTVMQPETYKPPHLRSKLPLRRIQIEDLYLNSDDDIAMLP